MLRTDVKLETVRIKVLACQTEMLGEHIQSSKHLTITSIKIQIVASTQVHLKLMQNEEQMNLIDRNGVSGCGMAKITIIFKNIIVLIQVGTQTNFLLQHSVASMMMLNPLRSVNMLSQIFIKTHTMDPVTDGQSEVQLKLTATFLIT
jgi:hypothetical protein